MARLTDYATLCDEAYSVPGTRAPAGWQVLESWSTATGFKGAIFVGGSEIVVAYAGTDTGAVGDLIADVTADIRLMIDMPRQTSDAYAMYNRGRALLDQHRLANLTVCGHSLGGGLSQHIGYWTKCNFVTFNAPGVYTGIQGTKVAFQHSPQKAWRTITATFSGEADGRNYRLSDDPVSMFGIHYGTVATILPAAGASGHGIGECLKALRANGQGGESPFGY